jgi:O-antigen ligase
MVTVLWSDPFPVRAITATLKRCAYVMIPVSVLFCKYYENWGRAFDSWGNSGYTGVTTDKNMFGYLLFAFGLLFAAGFMARVAQSRDERKRGRIDQMINILFLSMIGWLLPIANSKTALLSLVAGSAIVVTSQFATVRRHLWAYTVAGVLVIAAADNLFSVKGTLLEASGRDESFTGRTGIWEAVLKEPINPVVGTGYGSFWTGERLERFWRMYPRTPLIQAHNGYIETYLNLGMVGLCLLAAVLLTGLRKFRGRVAASLLPSRPLNDRIFATFGIAFGVAYLLYNVTEATFQGMNFLFTIFLILAFGAPAGVGLPMPINRSYRDHAAKRL